MPYSCHRIEQRQSSVSPVHKAQTGVSPSTLAVLQLVEGIIAYLDDESVYAQPLIAQALAFAPDPQTARDAMLWLTLGPYVQTLLSLREKHPEYWLGNGQENLYLIGDSHTLSPAHTVITLKDIIYRCVPQFIIGAQARHLTDAHPNQYQESFRRIVAFLPERAPIIAMFGDIDCHPDYGIIKYFKQTGRSDYKSYTADLVRRYVAFLIAETQHKNATLSLYGVAASNRTDYPEETLHIQRSLIVYFNHALQQEAEQHHLPFLDVYAYTAEENGKGKPDLYIDSNHLAPGILGALTVQI